MFINLPNIAALKCRIDLAMGRMPCTSARDWFERREWDGGHLHYFTYRSLTLLLQRSGFVVERREGFGPLGRLHNHWPSLLSVAVQLVARKPV